MERHTHAYENGSGSIYPRVGIDFSRSNIITGHCTDDFKC